MARVTAVYRPGDYPEPADGETRAELSELFAFLFPGQAEPEIDASHAGIAIAARSPKLALQLTRLSGLLAGGVAWSQRRDLFELAVQSVNLHFGCDYSFRCRLPVAAAAGVSEEAQHTLASTGRRAPTSTRSRSS